MGLAEFEPSQPIIPTPQFDPNSLRPDIHDNECLDEIGGHTDDAIREVIEQVITTSFSYIKCTYIKNLFYILNLNRRWSSRQKVAKFGFKQHQTVKLAVRGPTY